MHDLKPGELAIHIHGAEFGLVKAGLILLGHDQDLVLFVVFLTVEAIRQCRLRKSVDGRLSPCLAVHLQLARERHKGLYVGVALFVSSVSTYETHSAG